MPKFYQVARDSAGNVVTQATVTVYEAGTSTLASIYSDASLATALANPFTSATDGSYEFHARPGSYKVKVEKTGFSTFEEDNLPLPSRDATYNVHDYGAKGDGTVDDATAIQRAIDAAEAEEDGVVTFEARNYKIGSTLRVKRSVFLRGQGAGDNPGSGVSSAGTTRLVWSGSSGSGPMILFQAAASATWLFGGGVEAMVLDGANLAATGVHIDSCQYTTCGVPGRMVRLSAMQTYGIRISSTNGQRTRFCEVYGHYRAGGDAAAANSTGLFLDGIADGQTSHRIWFWYGVMADGPALRIDGWVDNCDFYFLGGFATGTGGQFRIENSAAVNPPITNLFHQINGGDLEIEDDSYGNIVHYHSSENGSISVASTASLHYRAHDKNQGDYFTTYLFPMDEELYFEAARFMAVSGAPTRDGTVGTIWGAWNLPNGAATRVGLLYRPRWADGTITKVRLHFSHTAVTSSVSWVGQVHLGTIAQGASNVLSPAEHVGTLQTIALNDNANRSEFHDYTLATPLAFTRGDMLGLSVGRVGTDGSDTFGSLLRFLGAAVFYKSDGPNMPGAGPYDVPLPYKP